MSAPIVFIGPHRAGKRTVGRLLAEQRDLPLVDIHRIPEAYQAALGFDEEAAHTAWREGGCDRFYHLLQPLHAQTVERVVPDHPDSVLILGEFFTVYDDPALLARVQQALQPCEHVVLLLPSPDVEASRRILEERGYVLFDGVDLNEHFIKHPSNHALARHVVYTDGRTPEQTCAEIVSRIDPAQDVILIGPMGAGKSTQGRLLAEKLGRPQVSMDAIRWDYYKEIGWDEAEQNRINEREGFAGVYRYWKRFEIHAVERALAEHHGCVIDFGAGHSVFEEEAHFERARRTLEPYANVILLLPSPDPDASCRLIRERETINGMPVSRFILTHPSLRELATHVVYTQGQTPEETCRAVQDLLSAR